MTSTTRIALLSWLCTLAAASVYGQKPTVLRVDTGGVNSNGNQARFAASGLDLYAVWADYRLGVGRIFFNHSTNAGGSWGPDAAVPTTPGVDRPHLAADGQVLHVVAGWNGAGTHALVHNRTLDGGATWLPNATVLDVAAGTHSPGLPYVACSGSVACVTWNVYDSGTGERTYVAQCSANAGSTWLPAPARIDTGVPTTTTGLGNPIAVVNGQNVAVVFFDPRAATRGIWCRTSPDAGQTWALPVRISAANAWPWRPVVAQEGARLHVAWFDWRTGIRQVRHASSPDFGATWSATDHRIDTGTSTRTSGGEPRLAVSGSTVYACWDDERTAFDGAVYCSRSLDHGDTWLPNDIRLTPPTQVNSWTYGGGDVAAQGAAAVIIWGRFGYPNAPSPFSSAWVTRSLDMGATWSPSMRFDGGPGLVYGWQLRAAAGSFHVLLGDNRPPNYDEGVFYALASGWQPYGTGLAGTGGLVPNLRGGGLALAGATFEFGLANGRAAAPALLGIGIGPGTRIAVPLLGGTQWVGIDLLLTSTLDAAGAASIPLVLPSSPILRGVNLNAQAAVFDPAAAQSFALTAAIEVWIG